MAITVELYKGEVKMVFDPYWHTYMITDLKNGVENQKVASVTTALKIIDKPQLLFWAVKMSIESMKEDLVAGKSYDELEIAGMLEKARTSHTKRKTSAGDAGTLLHRWVEAYINHENPPIPVNPMLKESCKKFLKWVHDNQVEFLISEQPVYSRKFSFTGTLDFICKIKGKLYIGDLKTSKGIFLEQMLQTAPYRAAREEEFPEEKYSGQLICRIGKDGSFEYKLLSDEAYPKLYQKMFMAFVCFLKGERLYRQLEKQLL
jgi:hypothetical protein